MARFECSLCGYVYDEAVDLTPWDELPDDWECPICGATRADFKALGEPESILPAGGGGSSRRFRCTICGYTYDERSEGVAFDRLSDDWRCPDCGAGRDDFTSLPVPGDGEPRRAAAEAAAANELAGYLADWRRASDDVEESLAVIQSMAVSAASTIEPMRSRKPVISWDEILFKGAQLARLPLDEGEVVSTRTVIGAGARRPLVLETPVYISHMSFGALSREAKIALAKGSAAVGTAIASGEGGILPDSMTAAHRYIFEYVPNRYSVNEDNLRAADAIEIKIGQSAKPGMGGHLPGSKVTDEIAAIRGFPAGEDVISPAHFADITTPEELAAKVAWLREVSDGRPIGVKLAAGHIEADLEVALAASPDFVTVDGRCGATGAAMKVVKDSTSIPTIFALARARRFLDARGGDTISLVITGGLRLSSDVAKALAMGADAVAIATAAMIACGCQQYRVCHTGRCPVGIATQDPELRARLDIERSAKRVANFLRVVTAELQDFARLTGRNDVHALSVSDLCTTSTEIARHTEVAHVGAADDTV